MWWACRTVNYGGPEGESAAAQHVQTHRIKEAWYWIHTNTGEVFKN